MVTLVIINGSGGGGGGSCSGRGSTATNEMVMNVHMVATILAAAMTIGATMIGLWEKRPIGPIDKFVTVTHALS